MTVIYTTVTTEQLIVSIRAAEREITRASGAFTLFAIFERADTPGRWDVVVSAPWLTTDRNGILVITQALVRHLNSQEALQIGRVVPLDPESNFVRAVLRSASAIDEGFVETRQILLAGIEIERGYILVAHDPPTPQRIGLRG